MNVEIKNDWFDALAIIPNDFPILKDNPNVSYLVHTAPVYRGRPDVNEGDYQISRWNSNNNTWRDIANGDIVLHWTVFTKVDESA